jgi:branched-chain amino acid transport system permease protein
VHTLEATDALETTTARPGRRLHGATRGIVFAVVALVVLFLLPGILDVILGNAASYWLLVVTGVVIYSIVTLGLGLLIGRVGMVSLCQVVLAALGAWVALRFDYLDWGIPFPLLLLIAGVVTGMIGTLIGLPALRLSGLYLALITLMAAGALTIWFQNVQFPNGGGGFSGNSAAGGAASFLPRPAIARSDAGYYRYCVVVAALMFLLALWHVRGKAGRAWAAIRQSQATAVAAGVNTVLYKLWAFALASFMAGVAGGLLAAAAGGVTVNQFPISNSVSLLAVVLMGGVFSLAGAVVSALLLRLLPALLDDWGVSIAWLTILFGIGVLQVLLTAPGGIVDQFPKDMAKLGRKLAGLVTGKGKGQEPTT